MNRRALAAVVFGDEALGRVPLKLLSLGLLVVALACAWWPHTQNSALWWWSWWGWQSSQVSFTPDFVSGSLSLAIIAPLYARRIIPYPHHSLNGVLFFLVNLSLTATFIQIALGKGSGFTTFPAIAVVMVAVALSWLGMRPAAALAWLALLVFSVVSTLLSNYAWGLAGFGFVACGFCGLLLQTPLNPNLLVAELVAEYSPRQGPLSAPEQERPPLPEHLGARLQQ